MSHRQLASAVRQLRRFAGPAHAASDDRTLLAAFARTRDETAFAELVRRHGPLVLGVCRRLLGDVHASDDVFQATFLVLARKAGKVRWGVTVGPWLYAVASRLARKTRGQASRERQRSGSLANSGRPAGSPNPAVAAAWAELRHLLDDELVRLPDRLRSPLVLCYLEGRTRDEAAAALGWTLATLKRRLERGRSLLRKRLEARGVTEGLLAPAIALVSVPLGLRVATTEAAAAFALDGTIAGPVAALLAGGSVVGVRSVFAIGAILLAGGAALLAGGDKPPTGPVANYPGVDAPHSPAPAVRRDPFGDPLPPGAVTRLGRPTFQHNPQLSSIALSPDGKYLATVSFDEVSVWQFPEDRLVGKPIVPSVSSNRVNWFVRACFANSGRQMITVESGNDIVRVIDLVTGKDVRHFGLSRLRQDKMWDQGDRVAQFSSDGATLAVLENSGAVALYDVAAGKRTLRLDSSPDTSAIALTRDGKTLVSAAPAELQVWEVTTGRKRRRFRGPDIVAFMNLSSDGRTLATVGGTDRDTDNHVRLWDVSNGAEMPSRAVHSRSVGDVAWAPDGRSFFTAEIGDVRPIRQWNATTGELARKFDFVFPALNRLLVTPDGQSLIALNRTDRIEVVNIATGQVQLPGRAGPVSRLAWGQDGIVFSCGRGVRRWDAASGKELGRADIRDSFSLASDGRFLAADASTFGNGAVGLWDAKTLKPVRRIVGLANDAYLSAFSPDGTRLATGGFGPVLNVCDLTTGKVLHPLVAPKGWVTAAIAFSGDGHQIVACGYIGQMGDPDWKCIIWDAATGRQLFTWDIADTDVFPLQPDFTKQWIGCTAIAPDGQTVALISESSNGRGTLLAQVALCDATNGRVIRRFEVDRPLRLAFSPDGKRIAVAEGRRPFAVRVLEIDSGRELATFTGHRANVLALAFSPDGKRLASGSIDTTVLIWDVSDLHPAKP